MCCVNLRPVEHAEYCTVTETEAGALRAAAVTAGPDATVPTCPEWTVQRLVAHTARVFALVTAALRAADPAAGRPSVTEPEGDFDTVLGAYDERLATMLEVLRAMDPAAPAWHPSPTAPKTAASLARRMAHESVMHRIDVQSVRGEEGPVGSELAADGVDEALTWLLQRWTDRWATSELDGIVLYHAADAGRAWTVRFVPGQIPQTAREAAAEPDASVVGLADAVFRAAWGRPSGATVTGDPVLVRAARAR